MCVESGMLKYTFSVPSPRNSNSVGLEWSPGSWIFNKDPQMISTTRYRNTILHVIHAAHLEPGCLQKHNEPEPRLISSRETPQPTKLPGHCSATAHRQNAPVSWGSSRLAINLLLIAGTPFHPRLSMPSFSAPPSSCHPFDGLDNHRDDPNNSRASVTWPPSLSSLHLGYVCLCHLFCAVINCSNSEITHSHVPLYSGAPIYPVLGFIHTSGPFLLHVQLGPPFLLMLITPCSEEQCSSSATLSRCGSLQPASTLAQSN